MAARVVAGPRPPWTIYVHWPYCARICPFCNFNKYRLPAAGVDTWRLADAYAADLQRQADRLDRSTRPPISLYFGGGTPSLAAPSLIERIVSWVHRRWQPSHLEVTLEANPTEAPLLRDFRLAGVNRLSLGVQSLRDASLKALGRTHTASMARDVLAEAARVFPDQFTFDLIYGRPHETSVADWRAELAEALELAGGHISLYQLTVEHGTPFAELRRSQPHIFPDDDLVADLHQVAEEETAARGYAHYQISNYALPGRASIHNSAYWLGYDYLGVGPGAHGRFRAADGRRLRTVQVPEPRQWQAAIESGSGGDASVSVVSPSDWHRELVLVGLQMREGIDSARFNLLRDDARASLADVRLPDLAVTARSLFIAQVLDMDRVELLASQGAVEWTGALLRPTAKGMRLLDYVTSRVLRFDDHNVTHPGI